jgi:hypothetical protein
MVPFRDVGASNGGVKAHTEPLRVCRAVVVVAHHFDKDPDQHQSEKRDPVPDPH